MNNERRKQIETVKERIAALLEMAEEIKTDLEQIRDDEQEYFDNMPEAFQEGEKGERAEAAVSVLDDVISDIESLIDSDFDSNLDTAAE